MLISPATVNMIVSASAAHTYSSFCMNSTISFVSFSYSTVFVSLDVVIPPALTLFSIHVFSRLLSWSLFLFRVLVCCLLLWVINFCSSCSVWIVFNLNVIPSMSVASLFNLFAFSAAVSFSIFVLIEFWRVLLFAVEFG